MDISADRTYTLSEATWELGVSEKDLSRWARDGEIKGASGGGRGVAWVLPGAGLLALAEKRGLPTDATRESRAEYERKMADYERRRTELAEIEAGTRTPEREHILAVDGRTALRWLAEGKITRWLFAYLEARAETEAAADELGIDLWGDGDGDRRTRTRALAERIVAEASALIDRLNAA